MMTSVIWTSCGAKWKKKKWEGETWTTYLSEKITFNIIKLLPPTISNSFTYKRVLIMVFWVMFCSHTITTTVHSHVNLWVYGTALCSLHLCKPHVTIHSIFPGSHHFCLTFIPFLLSTSWAFLPILSLHTLLPMTVLLQSHKTDFRTIVTSKGPWCTPTFTHNFSLNSLFTLSWVVVPSSFAITT